MAKHKCAAIGCKKEISMALVMCRDCWPKVPRELQRRILNSQHDWDRSAFERFLDQAKLHLRELLRADVEKPVDKYVEKSGRGVDGG